MSMYNSLFKSWKKTESKYYKTILWYFNMIVKKLIKQDELRMRICQLRKSHMDKLSHFTVKHFGNEGIPKSTVYRVLGNIDSGLGYLRKIGSGRIAKKMDKKRVNQLKICSIIIVVFHRIKELEDLIAINPILVKLLKLRRT